MEGLSSRGPTPSSFFASSLKCAYFASGHRKSEGISRTNFIEKSKNMQSEITQDPPGNPFGESRVAQNINI